MAFLSAVDILGNVGGFFNATLGMYIQPGVELPSVSATYTPKVLYAEWYIISPISLSAPDGSEATWSKFTKPVLNLNLLPEPALNCTSALKLKLGVPAPVEVNPPPDTTPLAVNVCVVKGPETFNVLVEGL